jgi:histidyl-tRNA synthetase
VIEHSLDRGQLPVKVFYSGAFFRAERPQAGRYRQFYQVGVESIGLDDPAIDAEIIALADSAFKKIGLRKYRLEITSLGDQQSRAAHKVDLVTFLDRLDLDEATRARAAINPLRLFDDKRSEIQEMMKGAPLLLDYLSAESKENFAHVCSLLDALGITYVINPRMVRGLDYYTGTTFEFIHEELGAQSGIGGGGRYDGLMQTLGGADLSGIGFGLGVDRVLLAAEAEGVLPTGEFVSDLFLIPLGIAAKKAALVIAQELRAEGIRVEIAFGDRALKGAMKAADKSGSAYAGVIGDTEIASGIIEIKRMSDGQVSSVKMSELKSALSPSASNFDRK